MKAALSKMPDEIKIRNADRVFFLLFAFIISIQGGWKTWVCNCHADRKIGLKK